MLGIEEPDAVVWASFLTLVGVCFTTVYSVRAKNWAKGAHAEAAAANVQASEANDAVNHRHPDSPRLFDLVVDQGHSIRELLEWKAQWDSLPPALKDAAHLQQTLHDINIRLDEQRHTLAEMAELARSHHPAVDAPPQG